MKQPALYCFVHFGSPMKGLCNPREAAECVDDNCLAASSLLEFGGCQGCLSVLSPSMATMCSESPLYSASLLCLSQHWPLYQLPIPPMSSRGTGDLACWNDLARYKAGDVMEEKRIVQNRLESLVWCLLKRKRKKSLAYRILKVECLEKGVL